MIKCQYLYHIIFLFIVLLILAGVTVATLTGDNGLLTKAAKAKEGVKDGEIGEQIKLACQEYKLGQYTGESGDLYDFIQGKMEDLCGTNNYTLTRMGRNIKIETAGRNKYYILKYDATVNEYDKIEKIAATDEMYGYLDEENEILYLRATPKTNYKQLTKDASSKSFIIKNNFDISKIEVINIEEPIAPTSGSSMFYQCNNLLEIQNINNLHTENMNNMGFMFRECKKLRYLDLNNFDTTKVTSMGSMFFLCNKLEKLTLDNFDTKNVTDMCEMFGSCETITDIDLSSFNTSNVTNMRQMFAGCTQIKNINVSSFDTRKVTNMNGMFLSCSSLIELDLSNFDTSNVLYMVEMIGRCSKLEKLDVSSFNTIKITYEDQIFGWNGKLKNLNLGKLFIIKEDDTTTFYQMLVGAPADIKITAVEDTANKIKKIHTNFTDENFEIVK